MEDEAIEDGFAHLKDGADYEKLYEAALCRERADWIVGINATRLFSTLYGQTLNVGRVMTPTLALVVEREAAIRSFKPESFYTVVLNCDGVALTSDRINDKEKAEVLADECKLVGQVLIIDATKKEKQEKAPALFDLTSLQREANRKLGYTAQQTLDYTQSLYEKKLVSYPRTDSRFLTEDMEEMLPGLFAKVEKIANCEATAEKNIKAIINGKKVTDHHAIIPTASVDKANLEELPSGEREVLKLIATSIALQRVSDLVCLEHGLSVIKPRRYDEREKRTVYPNRKSIRDKIREDIDLAMTKNPKNMNELLKFLEEMGYEIKRAKHIGIKGNEQKSFIRIDSLGKGYREFDFEKIFKGEESFNPPPREKQSHRYEKPEKKFDMLIDIQEIIAKGKGPGYERWAKVHNIKQISQTLIYLRDHDIRDMDELAKRAGESSARFSELSQTIKDAEKRMAEIAVLKTHIINYSKTKDIYVAYRKAGYSKQFFEAHREEILLHKAAKEAFGQLEGGVPKLKDLNQEYAELLQKKKDAYAEYRSIKEENKELQMAKHNLERFLNQQDKEQKAKEKQHNKNGQSL